MTTPLFIYPYRKGSNSVRLLQQSLSAKLIRLDNSRFKGGKHKNVLNWGNSEPNLEVSACTILNDPSQVRFASNKRNFFNKLSDESSVNIPEFTTNRSEALSWLEQDQCVCVREKLTGHSGEGLIVIENIEQWENYNHQEAKLYVKYIPKKDEYRVHVFNGEVIDIQKKSVVRGSAPSTYKIRNSSNGWIYTRGNINNIPDGMLDQCITAIKLLGLDFGAVDVIHNHYRKACYLLEVNTAPGLEGTTLENYVRTISNFFKIDYKEVSNGSRSGIEELASDSPSSERLYHILEELRSSTNRFSDTIDPWSSSTRTYSTSSNEVSDEG